MLVLIAGVLFAQDDFLEILRSDLKTQKVAIITDAMEFTEQESNVFWPLYKEYDFELTKLNDARIATIKDFANNYDTMTDVKAEELIKQSLKFQKDRVSLREKYFKKFKKILPVMKAAKFMQVENQLTNFIDAQLSAEIPLIEMPE
jgi:predicted GH43/DUF377 family glycosyl hydrolase